MAATERRHIDALNAHVEGLEAAVGGLNADPEVGTSLRRIARSLQVAAEQIGATEIAAGAQAIQRATDAQLGHSVTSFLERIEQIRSEVVTDDVQILLVEDNKTVAVATSAFLRGGRRTVHVVATAAEAEEALRAHPVDLVILDLILPDRDGRDLLVQLREAPETAHVPVVVLSAKGGSVARAECLAVGADAFMEKPAEPKALRSAVNRLLRHAKARRDAVLDGLTGLPNRVGLNEAFQKRTGHDEPAGSGTKETGRAVAVVRMQGWDRFGDAKGQDAAERILLEASATVHGLLDPGEVLGRWETGQLVALLDAAGADRLERFEAHAEEALGPLAVTDDPSAAVRFECGAVLVPADAGLHDAIAAAERSLLRPAPKPESEPTPAEPAPVADEAPRAPPEPAPPGIAPLARILLVEDDRVTGTLVHHRLVRDGHEVIDFDNGEDAFVFARDGSFDLAVLDVKVPGMDGFELLERLRDIERYANVPIIMLTGMGSEADVIRGLELGANDYMLKPFSPSELLARVRRLLQARRRSALRAVAQDAP